MMTKDVAQKESQHGHAWDSLSQLLPQRSTDADYWWDFTGQHLAELLEAAGYDLARQYEALLFHYHWFTPSMGPAPPKDKLSSWPTQLSSECLPIEYSWKWNKTSGRPEIRYTIEPISSVTGTPQDPLNQDATCDLLKRLQAAWPSVDLTWTKHFLKTLYDQDRSKYAGTKAFGPLYNSTTLLAAEFKDKGIDFKIYFAPRWPDVEGPGSTIDLWWERGIGAIAGGGTAGSVFLDFAHNTNQGKKLVPNMLAVDIVKPERSRLKLYVVSPLSSLSAVREMMSLGGRVPLSEDHWKELRSLIIAVTDSDPELSEDADLPKPLTFQPLGKNGAGETCPPPEDGHFYYVDIAPSLSLPEVKLFLRTDVYGRNEDSVAQGITTWMSSRGRGEYCQGYASALSTLSVGERPGEAKGIQASISCMFKDGKLEVTTYLGPERFPQVLYTTNS